MAFMDHRLDCGSGCFDVKMSEEDVLQSEVTLRSLSSHREDTLETSDAIAKR